MVDKQTILHDVSVVVPFNTGSDHHLLQVKIVLDEVREKKVLLLTLKEQRVKVMDEVWLQEAIGNKYWDQLQETDEDQEVLIQKLKECLRKAKVASQTETGGKSKKLLDKWRNMKRKGKDLVDYSVEKYRKEKFLKTVQK